MKRIRKGTFETNSSSVHALILAKEYQKDMLPKELEFNFFDMANDYDSPCYDIPNEYYADLKIKASIILEGIVKKCEYGDNDYEDDVKFITDTLNKVNVKAIFPNIAKNIILRIKSLVQDEHFSFVEESITAKNEDMLLRFLFGKETIIDSYETDCRNAEENFMARHKNFEFVDEEFIDQQ